MPFRVVFVHQGFEFLGVEAVAASLLRAGFEVGMVFDPRLFSDTYVHSRWLEPRFNYERETIERAVALDADAYLFSVVSPVQRWAARMAANLKRAKPDATVVFGGVHASAVPEKVLADPNVDYVVVGEGDEACVDLVRALSRGQRHTEAQNIAFRRDGVVVQNPVRPFMQDLDALPFPAKDLFVDEAPYFAFGYTIQSGRGCHLRCTFCYHSFFANLPSESRPGDRYVRRRSPANVVAELKLAKQRYDPKVVRFFDDNFVYNLDWLGEFADRYSREVGLPFWCLGNPDKLTREAVDCLQRAGCYELQMGVQTYSEETRRGLLARSETNADVENAIELLRGTKIRAACDNILGLPGQGEDELARLAGFYNRVRPSRINMYWLTYFAGARILELAEEAGWIPETEAHGYRADPPPVAIHVNAPGKGTPTQRRFQTLLSLLLFLPRPWIDWALATRAYRFLPVIDPFLLTGVIFNLRDRGAPPSLFQVRFFARYRTYMMRRVRRWLEAAGAMRPRAAASGVLGPLSADSVGP